MATPAAAQIESGFKQTVIETPAAGQDVPLSGLAYKVRQFEANVRSVRLKPRGAVDADPFVADWSFLGSNSDAQMHRLKIQLRFLDESGKELAMDSQPFVLKGGTREQSLNLETKLNAATWKATRKIRIVVHWIIN
jgi:hypothetical protein